MLPKKMIHHPTMVMPFHSDEGHFTIKSLLNEDCITPLLLWWRSLHNKGMLSNVKTASHPCFSEGHFTIKSISSWRRHPTLATLLKVTWQYRAYQVKTASHPCYSDEGNYTIKSMSSADCIPPMLLWWRSLHNQEHIKWRLHHILATRTKVTSQSRTYQAKTASHPCYSDEGHFTIKSILSEDCITPLLLRWRSLHNQEHIKQRLHHTLATQMKVTSQSRAY